MVRAMTEEANSKPDDDVEGAIWAAVL